MEDTLNKIGFTAMQFENVIHDLAMEACKKQSPSSVHWIMAEHDKIHRIVRRLNQVVAGN